MTKPTRIFSFWLIAYLAMASVSFAQLKYSVKPKQVIPYQVTITADTPTSVQTMKGIIAFTGQQIEGQNLTIAYSGGLTKSSKAKGVHLPVLGLGLVCGEAVHHGHEVRLTSRTFAVCHKQKTPL